VEWMWQKVGSLADMAALRFAICLLHCGRPKSTSSRWNAGAGVGPAWYSMHVQRTKRIANPRGGPVPRVLFVFSSGETKRMEEAGEGDVAF